MKKKTLTSTRKEEKSWVESFSLFFSLTEYHFVRFWHLSISWESLKIHKLPKNVRNGKKVLQKLTRLLDEGRIMKCSRHQKMNSQTGNDYTRLWHLHYLSVRWISLRKIGCLRVYTLLCGYRLQTENFTWFLCPLWSLLDCYGAVGNVRENVDGI